MFLEFKLSMPYTRRDLFRTVTDLIVIFLKLCHGVFLGGVRGAIAEGLYSTPQGLRRSNDLKKILLMLIDQNPSFKSGMIQ